MVDFYTYSEPLPKTLLIFAQYSLMIQDKIFTSVQALLLQVNAWKDQGDKIVFTNGCFDLIHKGHIHYLEEARSKGQRLVVALNSDRSVSSLKGSHRPINEVMSWRHFILQMLS
jgi:cytidyltransferase-like protein